MREVKNEMTELATICFADLEAILHEHTGNLIFADALERTGRGEELLCALSRYIHFNSPFGGGVANLAGEIAARQDLFRDGDEPVEMAADRSVEVAADIFFAAIDEFAGHVKMQRSTHRTMAQATLKAAGCFFNLSPSQLNELTKPSASTLTAIRKVRDGYRINQTVDEAQLFGAIGFHMGSEVLADKEFNILDAFLRSMYPSLVEYLRKTKVPINGSESAGYSWIQIHTTVEADHFGAAVQSANLALKYYAGTESLTRVKSWMLDGFRQFAGVQTEFMRNLLEREDASNF